MIEYLCSCTSVPANKYGSSFKLNLCPFNPKMLVYFISSELTCERIPYVSEQSERDMSTSILT